jgi:transposase-like protein
VTGPAPATSAPSGSAGSFAATALSEAGQWYLVARSSDPTGTGSTRWATRWKPALNAFAITFADRFPGAENY